MAINNLSENIYISWGVVVVIVGLVISVMGKTNNIENQITEIKTTQSNHINDPALHHNINARVNAEFVRLAEFNSRLEGFESKVDGLDARLEKMNTSIDKMTEIIIKSLNQ